MRLFAFGLGYTALALVRRHRELLSGVAGTVRSAAGAARLAEMGVEALVFDGLAADPRIAEEIAQADVLLVSIPPEDGGDPALRNFGTHIAAASRLSWIGYLSTIGVYGDRNGAWVDETTPCRPVTRRSRQRLEAEQAWLDLGRRSGRAVQVFRLAGIYGPGRNALANLAARTARRVVKPGHVFNRIHVDDVADVLAASIRRPRAGGVYNVADDEPAPFEDVVAYAAELAGIEPPPKVPFEEASLSPMAASFYEECKRASNRLVKEELGVVLRHPTYRDGLLALRQAGEGP